MTKPTEIVARGDMSSEEEMLAVFFPPVSDQELSNFGKMAKRCNACAYTDGTEANSTASTQVSRKTCDETGHPFWCHLNKNALGFSTHVCAGWIEHRKAMIEAGAAK